MHAKCASGHVRHTQLGCSSTCVMLSFAGCEGRLLGCEAPTAGCEAHAVRCEAQLLDVRRTLLSVRHSCRVYG